MKYMHPPHKYLPTGDVMKYMYYMYPPQKKERKKRKRKKKCHEIHVPSQEVMSCTACTLPIMIDTHNLHHACVIKHIYLPYH